MISSPVKAQWAPTQLRGCHSHNFSIQESLYSEFQTSKRQIYIITLTKSSSTHIGSKKCPSSLSLCTSETIYVALKWMAHQHLGDSLHYQRAHLEVLYWYTTEAHLSYGDALYNRLYYENILERVYILYSSAIRLGAKALVSSNCQVSIRDKNASEYSHNDVSCAVNLLFEWGFLQIHI